MIRHTLFALPVLFAASLARADDEPADPPQSHNSTPMVLFARAQGGYSLQTLYGVPIDSGTGSLALGFARGLGAYFTEGTLTFGATRQGLPVRSFDLGLGTELTLWRFRIGLGVLLGSIEIHRVTTAASLDSFEAGFRAHVTFDVLRWGPTEKPRGGIFVGLRGSAIVTSDPSVPGLLVYAGVRL